MLSSNDSLFSLVFLDIGNMPADIATISFVIGTAVSTTRSWEIKVTQVLCYSDGRFEFNLLLTVYVDIAHKDLGTICFTNVT